MADTAPAPDDGSSSTSAALQSLTNCVKTVTTRDFAYAKCAMSSGLFGIFVPTKEDYENGYEDDETSPELDLLLQSMEDLNRTGTCQLMCSRPTISASTSCCNAVARLHACGLSSSGRANEDVVACKSVIDQTFVYQRQCSALSAPNAVLIAVCAVVALVIGGVALFARITARRRASAQRKRSSSSRNGTRDLDDRAALPTAHNVSDDLEARFAAASPTRWYAFLGAYRQVANLVWKNLLLRRRKPVAFVMEQLLPLLLVGALLILANLDAIFRSSRFDWTTAEAYELPVYTYPGRGPGEQIGTTSNYTILCAGLLPIDEVDLGAPNATLRSFYTSGQSVLGLFFLVSYIKFVSTTTTAMVMEKENRMREVMKIMGLSDRSLLCAWCLTSAILSTPLAFAVAVVLKFGRVFPSEEVATLAFLFWSLSLAIVSFSYCITPFFNKSRTAAIVSVLVWLVLFFPFFAVQPKTNATKYWAALCPPTAFALGVDALLRHAQLGMGFAYAIAIVQSPIDVPTAGEMSWFLVLDSVLLVAIGWYLEQVLPQQYGVRKPFYFLFQKAYWVSGSGGGGTSQRRPKASQAALASRVSTPMLSSSGGDITVESATTPRDGGAYVQLVDSTEPHAGRRSSSHERLASSIEPVSAVLQTQELKGTCLQLHGLRKVFQLEDGDEHVAVDGLDLTMYCGQITALLGHNGAGKTTTISMLTGLIAPSAGDATLYGRSIQRDFHELRRIIGICPQHDVLFSDLTVDEHLQLFATMKNVAPSELRRAVDTIIDDVGLTETRHVRAKHLSGGQKRKLSVALAFIGDSKLVFLDEPTSGMDPYSRRFTWNVLQKHRADRVIVLTTHFMDEADILGDRIAIVADGKLCCAGSSLFLKSRYGAGYNLTLIKASGDASATQVGAFLQQFVPDATCLSSFGSELVFQLPTASSSAFPAMLAALDGHLAALHVLQYGISVTTLEEVFLRIARDREDGTALAGRTSLTFDAAPATMAAGLATLSTTPNHHRRSSLNAGSTDKAPLGDAPPHGPTFWSQYMALTRKRFQIARRDKKTLANAIGIPLLFLLLLAALPTIEVANFIPDYATTLASETQQLSCPAQNLTTSMLVGQNLTNCFSASGFGYCTLDVVDCDPQVCCNAANYHSPLYPCNTCGSDTTSSALAAVAAKAPCFNSKCMKRNDAKLQVTMNAFLVATVVMLGFAFIPAAIVAFVVREKAPEQDAKSLQLISGANVSAYWLASWTHDVAVTALSVIAAIVIVPLSARGLHGSQETLAVALLVILHMLASIPLAYLFSFRFSKHAVAQTSLLVFALSSGGLLSIFSFMCRVIDFRLSSTLMLSALDRNYLRWLFLLFPGYSLNNGIYEIAARKVSRRSLFGSGRTALGTASFFGWFEGLGKAPCRECWDRLSRTCCTRGVFDIDVSGAPIIYAAVEAAVFTVLVFYLENRRMVWRKRRDRTGALATPSSEAEDDDVAAERHRVETTPPSGDDSVFIRNLHQQYAPPRGKVALKNLSLAIRKGECFGYLGINGAGKSTTMKVLTGTLAPTDGFVMLGPHDLAYDRTRARRLIGYCPQFDALHDLLTVTEQLGLYARLKGVASVNVRSVVDEMIEHVGLSEYRHKLTRGLSGGNKRKVSTAIALIGSPPVVFLDEPSTGVDPSSRRKMWDVIASVCANKDASVVLTTHSMEECEALCTRVGIMVSGALQCLGSVEHLKQKFGHGFTVEVKLRAPPAAAVASVCAAIERALAQQTTAIARASARTSRLSQQDASELHADTSVRITASNIAQLCAALGEDARSERILRGDGNGWVVQHFFETTGSVPLDVFSAWWVSEGESEALQTFFADEFAGSTLVEQQGEHFRFQVPKHALRPSAIFALLEDARTRLHVSEYGVSDTSLEHIFNNMAAQQEEERGVVRGMYQQQHEHEHEQQ